MRRVVLVELDVGEIHLEDGRARVTHVEEHQLGLAQVHGRQSAGVETVKVHCNIVCRTLDGGLYESGNFFGTIQGQYDDYRHMDYVSETANRNRIR